jgi:hypothetical protein
LDESRGLEERGVWEGGRLYKDPSRELVKLPLVLVFRREIEIPFVPVVEIWLPAS